MRSSPLPPPLSLSIAAFLLLLLGFPATSESKSGLYFTRNRICVSQMCLAMTFKWRITYFLFPLPKKKWRMCGAEMVRRSDAPFGYQAAWTHARTHRHSPTHKGLFEGDAVYLDQSRDLNFLSHGELIILQRQGIQFRLFVHGFFVVTLKRAMVAHLLKARS